jgi:hypothetical protein
MRIYLWLFSLFISTAWAQPSIEQATPATTGGGVGVNVCNQGTPCNADTLWVNETVSCTGSPATVGGMSENLSLSPYGNGSAYATVTGCGPAAAENVVGGQTPIAAGTGYVATTAASPISGSDLVVIAGGTPVNGATFNAQIVGATGIMTINSFSAGTQVYLGEVLTWSGGPNAVIIRDFISGTGGTGTYQTTYSGSDVTAQSFTGTNRAVIRVLTVSAGGITAFGVVGGGQYSTAPGAAAAQLVTSGSGSGATFTLTYIGLPLTGQVASVAWNGSTGSFTFVSGVNAVTSYASKSEQLAIGHFDDAAMAAALSKNPVSLIFPATVKPAWATVPLAYGFQNPITLPNTYRFSLLCQGARIIALANMNAQITVPFQSQTSLFFKPVIEDCEFQGMGIANYNAYLSAARWVLQHSALENAVIENVLIGDGAGDAAANVVLTDNVLHTDTNAVPQWPAYNYEQNQSNDTQVLQTNGDTAIWGGMLINGADDRISGQSHFFAYAVGPCYDIEAIKTGLVSAICDNPPPGQAGYYLNATVSTIDAWQCAIGNGPYAGQYCIYVANDNHNTIGCGLLANNAPWVGNTANAVFFGATQTYTRVAPCTGNGYTDPAVFVGSLTDTGISGSTQCVQANSAGLLSGAGSACGASTPLLQSAIPFAVLPNTFVDTTGNIVIGVAPAASATITFGATSGATTVTCSAACFSNSASDVNRVVTVLDTTYKTCLITSQSSTTVANCTLAVSLSGTGPFANANSWISGSGTAAQSPGNGVTYPAAFSTTYASIYLYFSGVTAGPTAGMYYCVMASLATGTCYNNAYTSGKPAIPGSTTAFSGLTSGTMAQTTGSAIVLPQNTMLANTLGINGCIDYDAGTVSTNSANNKTVAVRLNTFGPNNPMTTQPVNRISVKMCNAGVNNSQVSIMQGQQATTANSQVGTTTGGVSRLSVATNANQTVSFSINLAAGTDNMVLEYYSIKTTAN